MILGSYGGDFRKFLGDTRKLPSDTQKLPVIGTISLKCGIVCAYSNVSEMGQLRRNVNGRSQYII